jgi:hypothetical protein
VINQAGQEIRPPSIRLRGSTLRTRLILEGGLMGKSRLVVMPLTLRTEWGLSCSSYPWPGQLTKGSIPNLRYGVIKRLLLVKLGVYWIAGENLESIDNES